MKKNEKKVPFFAQFLENQIKEDNGVKAGGGVLTDKLGDVIIVTLKYPSDDDEITSPMLDLIVTHKYPSDADEITSPMLDAF